MPHHPALPRRSAEEQARLHTAITELWEQRISFNSTLGLKIDSLDPASPRLRFEMRPDLVGHYLYGRLHGGVIASVLDAMGGYALILAIGEKFADESADHVMHRFARMGTIDLRIDYLRQGIGKHFLATAEITRLGGRVGSTLMRLFNDSGELIATGAGAYMVS